MSLSDDLISRWAPSVEQDQQAAEHLAQHPEQETVLTAHLLVGKHFGWWGSDIVVEPLPGLFTDRNEASRVICQAAQERHEQTGQPVTGGWTYHHLRRQGDPAPRSGDGRTWLTSWAVFEDCLSAQPPSD